MLSCPRTTRALDGLARTLLSGAVPVIDATVCAVISLRQHRPVQRLFPQVKPRARTQKEACHDPVDCG